MKKTLKRSLAALLAVFMLATVLSLSSFAYDTKTYNKYVCLGDSVAAGYSHPGYDMNHDFNKIEWNTVPGTYPAILRDTLQASTHMLAHSGYRSTDLRALLDNNYNGDGMSPLRLPSTNNDERHMNYDQLNVLRAAFQDYVAEADLITLNIGINDSTQPLLIATETVQKDLGVLGAEALAFLNPITLFSETLNNLSTLMTDAQFYAALAQAELTSFRAFQENFDAIVARIYALNPDVKLVVVGLYNCSENETIPNGGIGLPVGDMMGSIYSSMNNYMQNGSEYRTKYTFVDIWGISSHMNDPTSSMYMGDSHPTLNGHRQIADKILAVL